MATGFIYTVSTLTNRYVQESFCNVPTPFGDRIYFGACKRTMRPKIDPGDYIFGIFPAAIGPRRIVFVAHVEERTTFADAYRRFPELRGPQGPIHVEPVSRKGTFPRCSYRHIPGSIHPEDWEKDLASHGTDAFLVCGKQCGWLGRWLGEYGPVIDTAILDFLKTCSVYGGHGLLRAKNTDASIDHPIRYSNCFRGLHVETSRPEALLDLCNRRMANSASDLDHLPLPQPGKAQARRCSNVRGSSVCG